MATQKELQDQINRSGNKWKVDLTSEHEALQHQNDRELCNGCAHWRGIHDPPPVPNPENKIEGGACKREGCRCREFV